MKKTKKFRLFTVLIALCMLVGTIPAYAVNPYGSLTLTFTSEEDIDLGGIEISVYQAAPATVTETYTLYNETFHSTVTTNQNGSVTFAKPSQYCSITVELDSLPDGVGITKQTKFFNPDVTEQTIILATVDRAETELSGTEVKPTFYSADNVQLLADYEVVMSDNAYATMPWESIDAMDSFTLSGAFVDGNMSVPYSISVDISETNVVEKYKALHEYGMMSEKEMILRQCEVLIAPGNEHLITIETIVQLRKQRNKYLSSVGTISSSSQATYHALVPELTTLENTLKSCEAILASESSPNVLTFNDIAIICSQYTTTAYQNFADSILNEMGNIYYYFHTSAGFATPQNSDGTSTPVVIEIADSSKTSTYGYTVGNYIVLNYDLKDAEVPNRWKTTLAHEYQHVIQHAYGWMNDSWLTESFANFTSAMYALSLGEYNVRYIEYKDGINAYTSRTDRSINAVPANPYDLCYYSMLFPLYLFYNTGFSGWNTVIEVYEMTSTNYGTNEVEIFSALHQALQNINSTYSIKTYFENFAVDNLFLDSTYPTFYHSSWQDVAKRTYTAYQYASDTEIGIDPFGAVYHEISDFSDDTGVTITFDLISGNYTDFAVVGVIHNGNEPMESLHVNAPNPERFTLTLSNNAIEYYLGNSGGYTYYTLVAINTSYNTAMGYNITIN